MHDLLYSIVPVYSMNIIHTIFLHKSIIDNSQNITSRVHIQSRQVQRAQGWNAIWHFDLFIWHKPITEDNNNTAMQLQGIVMIKVIGENKNAHYA